MRELTEDYLYISYGWEPRQSIQQDQLVANWKLFKGSVWQDFLSLFSSIDPIWVHKKQLKYFQNKYLISSWFYIAKLKKISEHSLLYICMYSLHLFFHLRCVYLYEDFTWLFLQEQQRPAKAPWCANWLRGIRPNAKFFLFACFRGDMNTSENAWLRVVNPISQSLTPQCHVHGGFS